MGKFPKYQIEVNSHYDRFSTVIKEIISDLKIKNHEILVIPVGDKCFLATTDNNLGKLLLEHELSDMCKELSAVQAGNFVAKKTFTEYIGDLSLLRTVLR